MTVRIPADVDRPDRVLGPLTARQLGILAGTGLVLYGAYALTRAVLPVTVFLVLAIPVAATAAVLALGQRDGLSLDRLAVAAVRQRLSPRHHVAAPEGIRPTPAWLANHVAPSATGGMPGTAQEIVSPAPLRLPAEAVTDTGVIDLGADGVAVIAICSTINFSLCTPSEQEALVGAFSRFLHALTAGIQILVRTERLDLSDQIAQLRHEAGGLPHPALEHAAREHADYLDQLRRTTDLLRSQVLLILREPLSAGPSAERLGAMFGLRQHRAAVRRANAVDDGLRRAAEARVAQRLGEAVDLLAPAGITVTPLDAGTATGVLSAACNPDSLLPPGTGLAGANEVITTASDDEWDTTAFGPTVTATMPAHAEDSHAGDGWDDDTDDPEWSGR